MTKKTHLNTHLGEAAEDLNLVLGDELGEGDEESHLQSHQAVITHAVPI